MPQRDRHRRTVDATATAELRAAVRSIPVGELVYAAPASVNEPIVGAVVDVDGVLLALDTDENGVVWVHGADCPDLVRLAAPN
jgi:hypothetical protein